MERLIYLGFDPGKTGAMVALGADGTLLDATLFPMIGSGKTGDYNLHATRYWIQDLKGRRRATIEKVHSMPGNGAASMFSFGQGFMMPKSMCAALEIPYQLATPQAWQKEMLAGKPKGKDTKHSAVLAALELWPELSDNLALKKNQGIADAALIAEFGRRQWPGA